MNKGKFTLLRKFVLVWCYRLFYSVLIVVGFSSHSAFAQVEEPQDVDSTWSVNYEPFQIAGNLYYIGTYELACYLVTTPQGHILINTGLSSSDELIRRNIERLGYRVSDIKILLTNQAHFDHMGAMASLKQKTGAMFMVDAGDVNVAEDGGKSDYLFGGNTSTYHPVKVDRILHDSDKVKVGDVSLTVLHHPGHTKGSCSFMFTTSHNGRKYRVLIANMPKMLPQVDLSGMPGYPEVCEDFEYTYTHMQRLKFDIWVAAHASQFRLYNKHKPGDAPEPENFRDPKGYHALLNMLYQEFSNKKKAK